MYASRKWRANRLFLFGYKIGDAVTGSCSTEANESSQQWKSLKFVQVLEAESGVSSSNLEMVSLSTKMVLVRKNSTA